MVSQELLDILRCPADVRNGPNAGLLDLVNGAWLICRDCSRKYPIKDDIPVMLIEEGDKFRNTPVDQLGMPS
ncbi:MAG: Trm112 family protein [Chloroflexi bacterium]|nr:Trm112 family protein [Chloroflexota bacterium]MBI3733234.1 Trm112 family protein [Chloroflexota bacterium]